MLEHIVIIKFKEGTSKDHLVKVRDHLLALQGEIDTIKRITAGINFSDRNKGFSLGLVVTFDNKAGLEHYGPHPAHQKVVNELIGPHKVDVIAVDYDF